MKLRSTGYVWLCLIAGGAACAAQAETPYAYGPSSPAFAPSDINKVKAPGQEPVKAKPAQEKAVRSEDVTAGLPAGPQAYVPSAPAAAPAPVVEPVPVKAAVKPAIKAEAKVAPVKASAQTTLAMPVAGPAAAALPTCNYAQIRKSGFDAYVGRMWAARTPEAQKALIGCLDQTWAYHLSAANTDPNTHFEEMASPAMLAAMQYDVDG
ncbi:MAG TPA: hypothetical protein VG839_04795, partial [Asticcacaulis sp.]|nr:hypothetical protein [Asticcacaulis sp.]